MKNQILTQANYLWASLILFLASPLAFAQEGDGPGLDVDVDITKDQPVEDWMSNPLYWVIGGLVLLLIIAIIARSGRK